MAAGIVNLTILDGASNPRTMKVWSSDGTLSGVLSFIQTLAGGDQTNPATPANPVPVSQIATQAVPLGYQQLAGTGLQTLTVPGGATSAIITTEGPAARWRDDGTNPTTSIGMPIASGVPTRFAGDLAVLKLISSGASVTYNISYYG